MLIPLGKEAIVNIGEYTILTIWNSTNEDALRFKVSATMEGIQVTESNGGYKIQPEAARLEAREMFRTSMDKLAEISNPKND